MQSSRLILLENEVHIWRAPLTISSEMQNEFFATFNSQEKIRADRFHFPLHKRRFIAARGILRQLLSRYLNMTPEEINFLYQPRGKPYLDDQTLQFNVSHSHDLGVFVFTKYFQIGVDIEKIENRFNDNVAERFFHPEEYSQLQAVPMQEQASEFFRIWARKEALVKALGKGLPFLTNSFSTADCAPVHLEMDNEETVWYVKDFTVIPEYHSAFAMQNPAPEISHFEWV